MSKNIAIFIGKLLRAITFIFIILKLDGTITWSWWLVTAPAWSVVALVYIIGTVQFIERRIRMSKDDKYKIIRVILTLILLIFIVLKLTHIISWSWWWVTSPIWLPFLVIFIPATLKLIINLIKLYVKGRE